MSSKKSIEVNVWSDIACPWCYVAKNIFKQSLNKFNQNYKDYTVNIIFHAYMIDPQTKIDGEDYLDYNKRRWGSDSWTKQLKSVGKKYGSNFDNWKIWPNTLLCHKLVAEAKKIGKGNEVLEEIFKYCYELGKNVSDENILNEIANKYGINNWNTDENLKLVKNDEIIGKKNMELMLFLILFFQMMRLLKEHQVLNHFYMLLNKQLNNVLFIYKSYIF